ncbi:MAG TPA: ABC transporter substrate-binding protein, partial [Thermomicrobiales bacterium]|nr:ABC transporter substrate-binding protein [Thermomicrobiales bacterium]
MNAEERGERRHGRGRALSRRSVVRAGVLGAAGAAIGGRSWRIAAAAPRGTARAQAAASTLTIAVDGAPFDLDPHSQYDQRSTLAVRGPYEGLIGLKGDKTDEYEGILAERWEANDDKSVWTFHLRPNVTFQDGSPCDAEAVRASYARLLSMGKGAVNVVARFVPDAKQITAPDPQTIVFDCGRPQPLFETAMAATLGVQVVNVKVAMAHEADGDQGNAWLQTHADGAGTGPYRITQFEPGNQLVMERYDGYWGGWDGAHFDRIIIRVVEEAETRRQLLERGDVDIAQGFGPEAIAALASAPGVRVDHAPSTDVIYFVLTEGGPLTKPEARQAMCYAFPYDKVLAGVYDGAYTRAVGPVAATVQGFNPDTFV